MADSNRLFTRRLSGDKMVFDPDIGITDYEIRCITGICKITGNKKFGTYDPTPVYLEAGETYTNLQGTSALDFTVEAEGDSVADIYASIN